MNKGIELRLKYVKLIREDKNSEAWNVLNEIWDLEDPTRRKHNKLVLPIKVDLELEDEISFFKELKDINGIGKKIARKIIEEYHSKKNLKHALDHRLKEMKDKFRDDVVDKLNKELK